MIKQEFSDALRVKLSGLPEQDVEEQLAFYSEMIDDRIEEGATEEDAVSAIGSVDQIAEQILSEIPFSRLAKERIKPKRRIKAWEIVLLALGSPIWLSLGIAAFAVILSLYVVLWSFIVSLWAIFVSVAACVPACIAAGVLLICMENTALGIASISMSFVCAGLAIFLFFGCSAASKSIVVLTKKLALVVKKCVVKKERMA